MKPLSSVRGKVYDFDNVFYPSSSIPNFNGFCVDALADAAYCLPVLRKAGLTRETATSLADTGYEKYRDTFTSFVLWGVSLGILKEDIVAPLFHAYNERIRRLFFKYHPQLIRDRTDLQAAFQQSHGLIPQGIASHSCRQNLLIPFMQAMGIRQYFEDSAICGLEQSNFQLKHNVPTLVEQSFAALGVDPSEGMFMEDTERNLAVFKEAHPNCITVHIHHGHPLDKKPSHVDFEFYDLPEMKRAWHADKERGAYVIYSLPPTRNISAP